MNYMFKALIAKLEGDIEMAKANLIAYQRSPVGIGEHPDVMESIKSELAKLAEAEDMLEALQKHLK